MDRLIITIGYISEKCELDSIFCGDNEQPDIYELNYELNDIGLLGLDNDFKAVCKNKDLWDPRSEFYQSFTSFTENFIGVKLPENILYEAYSFVNDEHIAGIQKFELIESDAGIIFNTSGSLNGKFYYRYYQEEEGEIIDEIVIVTKSKL